PEAAAAREKPKTVEEKPVARPEKPAPPPPVPPPDPSEAGACPDKNADVGLGLVVSPLRAVVGAPLRILTATFGTTDRLALRIETAKGEPVQADVVYRGGTPAMTVARLVPKS